MYPFITFFGTRIPTYGVMMLVGCTLCVLISLSRCKRYACSKDNVVIILACSGGIALIGAKLLYLFVSVPISQLMKIMHANPLTLIIDGGQVFYGGVIGGIIGAAIGVKVAGEKKVNRYVLAILPGIPLGHAMGRIGCLMAGCCYGVPYHGFGAVHYNTPIGSAPVNVSLFPVQGLETLLNIIIFIILLRISKKSADGMLLVMTYTGLYCVVRFSIEYLRYDDIRGGALTLSTAQWISALLAFSVLVCGIFRMRAQKRSV